MKAFLLKHKLKSALTVAILFLTLLFLWRSCSPAETRSHPIYYTIAADPTWYPLEFEGREKNMTAFVNELFDAIGVLQPIHVSLYQVGAGALRFGLDRGDFDGVLSTIEPDLFLTNKYIFSEPIYLTGPVIVMKEGEDLEQLDKENKHVIAVQRGNMTAIRSSQISYKLQVRPYDNMRAGLDDLIDDKVDAVMMEAIPAHIYENSFYKGKIHIVTDPLSGLGLRIMTLKNPGNQHFIDRFDEGLKTLVENGTYRSLIEKWGIINTRIEAK